VAARTSGELMDTVAEIEALKSALDAVELKVVRELDVTPGSSQAGWASTRDFVTAVAGGTKASGPAVVRLAQAVAGPGAGAGGRGARRRVALHRQGAGDRPRD
jgi:hypothetical protein